MVPFFYLFYRFGRGIWRSLKDPEFEALFTLLLLIVAVGTYFYHLTEKWSWFDSMYFSFITLTTVGYGDLYPHTVAGKLFTIVYLLVGIGVLLSFVSYVAQNAVDERRGKSILPWRNGKQDSESSSS